MNFLKSAARKLGEDIGVLATPLFETLELEISSSCNLRCATCPNNTHSRAHAELPTEVIRSVVMQLKELNYSGSFSPHFYNEPLLDARLPEILDMVRENLPKVTINLFTNFTRMTVDLYRRLLTAVDAIIVTIDEPRVQRKVEAISAELSEEERLKLRLRSLQGVGLSNRAGAVDISGENGTRLEQCHFPLHYMVIDASGNAHLCCNDYFGKALFGNVTERPLIDIWRDPQFARARKLASQARHPLCRGCFWTAEGS